MTRVYLSTSKNPHSSNGSLVELSGAPGIVEEPARTGMVGRNNHFPFSTCFNSG